MKKYNWAQAGGGLAFGGGALLLAASLWFSVDAWIRVQELQQQVLVQAIAPELYEQRLTQAKKDLQMALVGVSFGLFFMLAGVGVAVKGDIAEYFAKHSDVRVEENVGGNRGQQQPKGQQQPGPQNRRR